MRDFAENMIFFVSTSDENMQIFYSAGNNMRDREGGHPSMGGSKKTFTVTVTTLFIKTEKNILPITNN